MKKTIALLTTAFITVVLVSFSIGFTLAYFTDTDTAVGASISTGSLDVSIDIKLANYGVPSDELLDFYGNKDTPAKSTVTVKNNGSIDMDYTLSLTVNKETADLLDTNGFELRDATGAALLYDGPPTTDAAGNETYVYKSTSALEAGQSDVFGLALTFKGATLLDGNEYQGAEISVTPTVVAIQERGTE